MNSVLLKNTIDSLYEEYLKVWEDICNIESPTWNKEEWIKWGNIFPKLQKNVDGRLKF